MTLMSVFLASLFVLNVIGTGNIEVDYTKGKRDVKGFITRVFNDNNNNNPVIVFGNKEKKKQVFCLEYASFYETNYFDINTGKSVIIENSFVDLSSGISSWIYHNYKNKTFSVKSNGFSDSRLRNLGTQIKFVFDITKIKGNSYGLKYSFYLNNYEFISNDNSTQFVLDIDLKKCDNYNLDSQSDSASNDESSDDDRRRIAESDDDSDSNDSDDSSSDSEEATLKIAIFKNTPNANKICNETITSINVDMYTNTQNDKEISVSLIFDNFNGCNLIQDPYIFVDRSRYLNAVQITFIVLGVLLLFIIIVVCLVIYYKRKKGLKKPADNKRVNSYESPMDGDKTKTVQA